MTLQFSGNQLSRFLASRTSFIRRKSSSAIVSGVPVATLMTVNGLIGPEVQWKVRWFCPHFLSASAEVIIKSHLPLDQVAQSPIQPGLKHFHGGGRHNFSGQSVPVPLHPHSKEFFPYI